MQFIEVSAWPYTREDLEVAIHANKLPLRDTITINVDYKQRGVGGGFNFRVIVRGRTNDNKI